METSFTSSGVFFSLQKDKADQTHAELHFLGANPQVALSGEDKLASQTNYLIGSDRSRWRTHVANFAHVRYSEIYPGIDLVFYGTSSDLEHDFVIRPGANAGAISFSFSGGKSLSLDSGGTLRVELKDATLVFRKPVAYQVTASGRKEIPVAFARTHDKIGFKLGSYDHSRELIIDPAVIFSTYLANVQVTISGVAADSAGNTYIAGLAFSSSYPTTTGAFRTTCSSCPQFPDVFITKIAADGGSQVYSTFLGGSDYDQAFGIAVDGSGNAVVAGRTESLDFPLMNAILHGTANTGTFYGFVSSLSPDGSSLNYSSLLGGGAQNESTTTIINAVTLDANGDSYVAGTTDSPVIPTTVGALDLVTPVYPKQVAFVTKFLASGTVGTIGTVGYGALLGDVSPQNGGGGPIGVAGIAVDSSGNAYITGNAGTLWPTTPGAYQTTIPGAAPYAAPFITKITSDGSKIAYSTFIGAPGGGSSFAIAVDGNGDAFITGNEVSSGFPTTQNAYLRALPNGDCCQSFLSEVSPDGSSLLYSTFFAGGSSTPFTQTNSSFVSLDNNGNIWLAGSTSDPQFPLVHPIQSLFPNQDVFINRTGFVSRFDPAGQSLTFSTYFGDLTAGEVDGLAVGQNGKAFIAGFTGPDLYTTPGAYLSSVPPPAPNTEAIYGYSAAIDADALGAAACLPYPLNQGLSFSDTPINTTSSRQVSISSCGSTALSVSAIQSSNGVFTIPPQTNTCLQPVAVNNSCTFNVVFSPTIAQPYGGTISISSNAAIPEVSLQVTGTGAVPVIQFEPSSETFDPQFIHITSPVRGIFITNAGRAPLVIDLASSSATGPFAFTNFSSCDQPVFPTQSCVLSLTFTPQVAGTATGNLVIASNDPINPTVTIPLSGMGFDAYPISTLTSVVNPDAALGSSSVMVKVFGSNFFPASTVRVNGITQTTTYLSSNFLEAQLDDSLFTTVGQLPVTVFNPAPGGGESAPVSLTVYRSVPLLASAMTYDTFTQQLFAAIPASSASNANSVVAIDPLTGKIGPSIAVGNDPQRLAVSDDGQFLYVALNGDHAIQRINVGSSTVEKTFALPVDPIFGNLTVVDMKVVPGSPKSVVAALFMGNDTEDGIATFSDSGLVNWLANSSQGARIDVDSFAFVGNPPVVYATPFTFGSSPFFPIFSLDASGLQLQSLFGSPAETSGFLISDGNLIYINNGQVWDATKKQKVGTLNPAPQASPSIVPDDFAERIFALNRFAVYADTQAIGVDVYDQDTLNQTTSVPFVSLSGLVPADLFRWGADGFAFRANSFPSSNGNQVVLFTSRVAQSRISLSTSTPSLQFGSLAVGGKSDAMALTLANSGDLDAVIGSISITGDFAQSNQCKDIQGGGSCQINITFAPSAIGFRSGLMTISSAALAKPITVALSGTGTAAVVSLSSPTLMFASQIVNTASGAQKVTVSNSGNIPLVISGVTVSGDFSQSNTCGSVAPGANCVISVIFEPTLAGSRSGSLIISDNDASGSQTVALSGPGADVQIASVGGTGTTSTVRPGQPANYNLSVSPTGGFTGPVSFSCSNLPQFAACNINPPTATLGASALNVSITITTSQQSSMIGANSETAFAAISWIALLAMLPLWRAGRNLSRSARVKLSIVLFAIVLAGLPMVACGGGGGSMTSPPPPPTPITSSTPQGTYTVNFTATSSGISRTVPLTLVVQ